MLAALAALSASHWSSVFYTLIVLVGLPYQLASMASGYGLAGGKKSIPPNWIFPAPKS